MNKNTPLARGVRTFLVALAGVAATAATLDLLADARLSAIQITLGIIAAALAGLFSFLQAVASWLPTATTPLGKAVATFAQFFLAAAGTVAVTELTTDALASAGTVLLRSALTAFLAAIATLLQNSAEDQAPVVG